MAPKGKHIMNGLRHRNEAVMPHRSLLSTEQRTRLFAMPVDHAEMGLVEDTPENHSQAG